MPWIDDMEEGTKGELEWELVIFFLELDWGAFDAIWWSVAGKGHGGGV